MKSEDERCAQYEQFKRIDACETPREMAEKVCLREIGKGIARSFCRSSGGIGLS